MNRVIPVRTHMAAEPVLFLVLLLAPFLFGFSDVEAARNVSIAAAIVVLIVTLLTDWSLSITRAIPLPVHGILDALLGLALVVAPFAAGYSDDSTAATIVHVLLGIGFITAGFLTNWGGAHDRARARRTRGPAR